MTNAPTTDRIEKSLQINAPVNRVWRALTDYREFSQWFRVALEGPFVVSETTRGRITYPGYEHLVMELRVVTIEPEHRFAFTWHPYAIEPRVDYSKEPPTLVEFHLTPSSGGTLLRVVESGFDAIPLGRRAEAFRMNSQGWQIQLNNIAAHVQA